MQESKPSISSLLALPYKWGERLAWICLLAVCLFVPIAFGNFTLIGLGSLGSISYDQFDLVKKTVLEVFVYTAFLGISVSILFEKTKIRVSPVFILLILFIVWALISNLCAIDKDLSFFGKYRRYEGTLVFIDYALLAFVALQLVDRRSRLNLVLKTFLVSSFFVASYGFAQFLQLDPISWGSLGFESRRAFAMYGNPNMLGSFIVMPLSIAFAFALSSKHRVEKIVYWLLFLLFALVCLVTFTRGAWLGAFVGVVTVCVLALRCKISLTKVDKVFIALIAAALILVMIVSSVLGDSATNVASRIISAFSGSGSASTRSMIGASALEAIKDRPLFGWGADSFRLIFPMYKLPEYAQAAGALSVADNAHNYPLQLSAGVGIPGTLLAYAFFIASLIYAHLHFNSKEHAQENFGVCAVVAAVCAYLVDMFFGLSLTGTTSFLYLFSAILAGYGSSRLKALESSNYPKLTNALKAGVLILIFVFSCFGYIQTIKTFYADHIFLQASRKSNIFKAEQIEEAIKLNPHNDYYKTQAGIAYYNWYGDRRAAFNEIKENQGREAALNSHLANELHAAQLSAEKSLLSAIEFTPYEYDNYVFLVSLYNDIARQGGSSTAKAAKAALETSEKELERVPYGVALLIQYSIALDTNGQSDKALEVAKQAAELDERYIAAWKNLEQLADKNQRPAELSYAQEHIAQLKQSGLAR